MAGFEDWLRASEGFVAFSLLLSGSFLESSAGRPRPLGVVGVLDRGEFIEDLFDATATFVTDIGASLSADYSTDLVAGLEAPFVSPFDVAAPSIVL